MKNTVVNLNNCDSEPIHISGHIQSHGFLVGIDEDQIICYYSENIKSFLPELTDKLFGQNVNRLLTFFGINNPVEFISNLISSSIESGFEQHRPYPVNLGSQPYYLLLSPADPYYLLEFEPAIEDLHSNIQKVIGRSMSEMIADRNLSNLLHNTVVQVKKVIQYDRVMIYRFAEDGHGEVIAEAKNEDLKPFLWQHYPASDIPKQARELYKQNFTRLIGNVHSIPSPVLASPILEHKPLNLTYSQLRAVSEIHIQYLKNMTVESSFSISLMYRNELWGLIACHNYTPRYIDYKARESAWLLGLILSSGLEFKKDEENILVSEKFKLSGDSLSKYLHSSDNLKMALTGHQTTLLDVADVTGAVLLFDNNFCKLGKTPNDSQMKELVLWLKTQTITSLYYTSELSVVYPPATVFSDIASGIMVLKISNNEEEYIILFKPEVRQTIRWAGNPNDKMETVIDKGMKNISPRLSFEVWLQSFKEKSGKWTDQEISSVTRLREDVVFAINQKAVEISKMNEKLKLAYDELDTFSYTISHDLKNPIAAIKGYSELLKMDVQSEDSIFAVSRIIAGADRMNRMINEILQYSQIGNLNLYRTNIKTRSVIEEVIEELKVIYPERKIEFQISRTPDLYGDRLMIGQVFSNLLANAVKYSLNSNPAVIYIDGSLVDGEIIYEITDNGMGIATKHLSDIFGLFQRLDNVKDIAGSGVGLAIVKRIMDKHHGRIWVESEPGKGSSFYIAFKQ